MISPCINICQLSNGVCIGCHRTISEITNWTKYTDAERKEVINILKERKNDRDSQKNHSEND